MSHVTLRSSRDGEAAGGSFYEAVGGHATFDRLVRAFYEGVKTDPILLPMYPEDDLEGAIWRLTAFLEQYWGGPGTYSVERGHPRLRMRHFAWQIDEAARDAWLANMQRAVTQIGLSPEHEAQLWSYLTRAAESLRNAE